MGSGNDLVLCGGVVGGRRTAGDEADSETEEHDEPEDPEGWRMRVVETHAVRYLRRVVPPVDQELDADDDDEQVGAGLEAGKTFKELDEEYGGEAHQDHPEHAAGDDDPELVVRAGVVSGLLTDQAH